MIALALLLAQDPLAKPVTLPATVDDAKSVVKALSEASGVKMAIMPALEREVVGLASPNKPLKLSMNAIAKAMDAEWSLRDGVQTLARTNALAESRRKRDFATRLEFVKKGIAEATASLSGAPFGIAEARQLAKDAVGPRVSDPALVAKSPFQRLFRRVLLALPPEDLAGIQMDERLVYTFRANKAQRPLPESARSVFEQYAKEQKALIEAMAEVAEPAQPFHLHTYENDGTFENAMVVVYRQQLFSQGMLGIEFRLFNKAGAITASTGTGFAHTGYVTPAVTTRGFTSPADDVAVEPHPDVKRFRSHLQRRASAKNDIAPFPPEMDDLLRHPDTHEPMAMLASAPMAAIAKHKDRVVAAAFPDTILYDLIRSPGDGRTSIARWEDDLIIHNIERIGNFESVIYRPRLPILGDEIFTDRNALAEFLATLTREGRGRLEPNVKFAVQNTPGEALYARAFLGRLRCQWGGDFMGRLRFFGSLSPTQRSRLKAGGVLTFADLSEWQVDYFRRKAFGTDQGFHKWPTATEEGVKTANSWMGNAYSDITYRFPNGIPDDFELRATVQEKLSFSSQEAGPGYYSRIVDAVTIAQAMHEKETGDDRQPVSDSLDEVSTTAWSFEAKVGGGVWSGYVLSDNLFTGKTRKVSDLPAAMKAEIEKELNARRQPPSNPPKDKVPPPSSAPFPR